MPTRFTAPLPAPAGVQTRHPRTRRWWAALAPRPTQRGRTVHGDWMTFTVHSAEAASAETWAAQQLRGDVSIELVPGRFTVWTMVEDIANGRPEKGLRKWLDRGRRFTPVGATVPTSSIARIEVSAEYPTSSADLAEQAHIAAHGRGWVQSARLRVVFLVEHHECDAVVDFHELRTDDEDSIWELVRQIVEERYRHGVVTEPRLEHGHLVRVRTHEAPPLDIVDHPADPPRHFRRTLDLRLPGAEPVALGEPARGSLDADGLGDALFGE